MHTIEFLVSATHTKEFLAWAIHTKEFLAWAIHTIEFLVSATHTKEFLAWAIHTGPNIVYSAYRTLGLEPKQDYNTIPPPKLIKTQGKLLPSCVTFNKLASFLKQF